MGVRGHAWACVGVRGYAWAGGGQAGGRGTNGDRWPDLLDVGITYLQLLLHRIHLGCSVLCVRVMCVCVCVCVCVCARMSVFGLDAATSLFQLFLVLVFLLLEFLRLLLKPI